MAAVLNWTEDELFPGDYVAHHGHKTFVISWVTDAFRSPERQRRGFRLVVWGSQGIDNRPLMDETGIDSIERAKEMAEQFLSKRIAAKAAVRQRREIRQASRKTKPMSGASQSQ